MRLDRREEINKKALTLQTPTDNCLGFPSGSVVKNPPAMQETWVQSLDQEDPLEKEMEPTLVFLPGKSHGQRSLVGCNPWGDKELDTA